MEENPPHHRSTDTILDQAEAAFYAGDFSKAIELYKKVLGIEPDRDRAKEQLKQAQEYIERGDIPVQALPSEARVAYERALEATREGKYEVALQFLDSAKNALDRAGVRRWQDGYQLRQEIEQNLSTKRYVEEAFRRAQATEKHLQEVSQELQEQLDTIRQASGRLSTGKLYPEYVDLYEKLQDLKKREKLRFGSGVPIIQGEKIIGVLNVESSFRQFKDSDMELLKSLAEHAAIAITSGQVEVSESSSNIVLSSDENQTLNPDFLVTSVSPYLSAIGDIQRILNEIFGRPQREIRIKAITQQSPISVSLDGAADAVQIVQNTVIPWRRKHAESMARLLEQEKQAEIESKKAEILEKRASAAKSRAEAGKLVADAAKQHEEAEKLKLENEKLRLDLHRAKIQLASDMLSQLAPGLSETEKIAYLVKLLPPLEVVIFSNLEISALTNTKDAG